MATSVEATMRLWNMGIRFTALPAQVKPAL